MGFPPDPYSDDPFSSLSVIFRRIPDFPGYGVDTNSNIWSCLRVGRFGGIDGHWHALSQGLVGPYLYRNVMLRRDGRSFTRYVHRLMLEAFVGPCPAGMEALHRDCDTGNNSLRNLRWGTSAENSADSISLDRQLKGESIHNSILKAEDIPRIFELRRAGLRHQDIADRFGVCRPVISCVLSRKLWKHVLIPEPSVAR